MELHMEILLPVSILSFFVVIGIWFCNDVLNFIRIGQPVTELWRSVDFPKWRHMAAIPSQIYVRLRVLRHFTFRKANNYSHTKFRPRPRYYYFRLLKTNVHHIKILLPVSVLTSIHRRRYVHRPTKLCPNLMITDGVMTSYW